MPGFDPSVPSPARMYDYYLGGKDNFAADREAAEQALSVVPFGREVARANRQFLVRAVTFMARSGIGQFIDLGTGLPTRPNVHEVARSVLPDARVLYVDNDPMVCSHARALLATNDGVAAIQGDIRTPQAILNDPVTRELIDFTRPVGVLFVAVLHFLTDDDQPWEQVAAFRWRMASGSMLAVSHITSDGTPPASRPPSATSTPRPAPRQCSGPGKRSRASSAGWIWSSPASWRSAPGAACAHLRLRRCASSAAWQGSSPAAGNHEPASGADPAFTPASGHGRDSLLGPLSSSLNSAPCRPRCRAPGCTPSTSRGSGD